VGSTHLEKLPGELVARALEEAVLHRRAFTVEELHVDGVRLPFVLARLLALKALEVVLGRVDLLELELRRDGPVGHLGAAKASAPRRSPLAEGSGG